MRTALILIVTLAILALGFGIYWTMQNTGQPGTPATGSRAGVAATQPTTLPTDNAGFIGPAQNVWYIHYDGRTGRPTSRVRAQRYEPQKDGRVLVFKPEAEFFSYEDNEIRQVMRIVGESGYLTMQESISRGRTRDIEGAPASQSPRAGDLKDVTLLVLDGLDVPAEQATITMTMPNASFDNELFRISTEAYRDDRGRLIARDQVPVKIRGDYEFDGKGLTIIYNEQYGRIDRLEIAHGQRLLIKKPGEFMKSDVTRRAKPAGAAFNAAPTRAWDAYVLPMPGILLAAADNAAAIQAAASATEAPRTPRRPARPPSEPDPNAEQPVYRAIFKQNVRVNQGGKPAALAEEMHIFFLQEEKPEAPATQPVMLAITPSAAAVPPLAAAPLSAAPAAATPAAAKAPTTRPARKAPTTQPLGDEPIEVLWNGPLVVVPIVGARPERIAPGEAIIRFTGSPARPAQVMRMENDVRTNLTCGTLTYWTLDQGALLEETGGVPVHMTDTRGTDIRTHRMVFSDADGTAQLFGVSQAKLPLDEKDRSGAPQVMDVSWSSHCTLHFDPAGGQDMTISAADLIGDVKVRHPELKMDADALNLQFDTTVPTTRPATTQPTTQPARKAPPLRQLEARGKVLCEVDGPGGEKDKRSIAANALTLLTAHTPEGKLYARNLHAFGAVEAIDPERTMKAGVLTVTLAEPAEKATTRPTTRPAKMDIAPGELRSLVAQDNVQITTADGKKAFADSLNIQKRDERTTVALHGRPAKVMREKDTLSGEQITLIPETQELLIIGSGRLDGIQQEAPDKPERPMELTWTRSLMGRGDNIEAEGNVYAKNIDVDGSVNIAKGDRVVIATTRPATTQPAVAQKDAAPTTRPTGDLDVLSNRVIQSLNLIGNAQTTSTLTTPAGDLLRRFHVDSGEMRYTRRSEIDQQFLIPGAGRLSFEDYRPPADTKNAKSAAEDPMNLRGKTGFMWKESMLYDEKSHQITMTGNVIVGREEVNPKGPERLYVAGDKIIADLVPPDPNAPKTQPATRPATQPAFGLGGDLSKKMELKHVRVEGNVRVRSDKLNVEAATIDYDPVSGTMTMRGSAGQPVRQFDADNVPQASFEEMIWNTKTSKIIASKLRGESNK